MTIAERIHAFLSEERPRAFCDDCIQEKLELPRRQEVAPVTKSLGLTDRFTRCRDFCNSCARPRLKFVICCVGNVSTRQGGER